MANTGRLRNRHNRARSATIGPRRGNVNATTPTSKRLPDWMSAMNWDRIEGKWKQLRGSLRKRWGKLTDDDLDVIAGQRDVLAGRIQERYGVAKDEAERQVTDFERQLDRGV